MIRAFATCTLLVIAMAILPCCGSTEPKPEPFVLEPGAKVRNVRPNLPNQKAERFFQINLIYVLASSDLTEAWSLLSTTGLQANQLEVWRGNGLRAATADDATLKQFFSKLTGYGGTKQVTLGAGRDPVAIETTPPVEQAVIVRGLLGLDRDETFKLPSGRTQFLTLLEPGQEKSTLEITPHHHWSSVSVSPRTPEEKALDGRVFRELPLRVDLGREQYLLIGYVPPARPAPNEDVAKGPAEDAGLPRRFVRPELEPADDKREPIAPPPASHSATPLTTARIAESTPATPATPALPTRTSPATPATTSVPPANAEANSAVMPPESGDVERPAGAVPLPPKVQKPEPSLPSLGDLLLTGERGGKRLQVICVIRIPTQGEAREAGAEVKPEGKKKQE